MIYPNKQRERKSQSKKRLAGDEEPVVAMGRGQDQFQKKHSQSLRFFSNNYDLKTKQNKHSLIRHNQNPFHTPELVSS